MKEALFAAMASVGLILITFVRICKTANVAVKEICDMIAYFFKTLLIVEQTREEIDQIKARRNKKRPATKRRKHK